MKNELSSIETSSLQVGTLVVAGGDTVVVGSDSVGTRPLDVPDFGGLTLGYTELTDSGNVLTTTSYAVVDSDAKVTFTAPISGNVEILCSLFVLDVSGTAYNYYVSLSTASSYSALGNAYSRIIGRQDTNDDQSTDVFFYLTGLTPGQSYTYYLAVKNSVSNNKNRILWGNVSGIVYPSVVMHAKSLPETVYTG
jgi:hypothetical protein|tara:strand:+ start:247 stop:828 length:582 start_codon:yes stop_codon:yes gene_type:complete